MHCIVENVTPKVREENIFDMKTGDMFLEGNRVCMVIDALDYKTECVPFKSSGEIRKCFVYMDTGRINSYSKKKDSLFTLKFKMLVSDSLKVNLSFV